MHTVKITPRPEDKTDFDEVPAPLELEDGDHIDPSDRMFLAVAAAHPEHPPIVQATDSKWIGWEAELAKHGIAIEWLCREYAEGRFENKMGRRADARIVRGGSKRKRKARR
jgi:hypothetical protein